MGLTSGLAAVMTGRAFWDLLKQTAKDWAQDKASRLASSLAYYTVFSLAPMLVIAVVIAGAVLRDSANAQNKVVAAMSQVVGGVDEDQTREMIANASKHGSGVMATVISVIILIYGASGVFAELQDSMNTIWEIKLKDNLSWMETIRKRFVSVAMVFGIAFLLMVSLVITTVLTVIVQKTTGGGNGSTAGKVLTFGADVVVSVTVVMLLFAAIFKFLPDAMVQWRDVWLGAFITGALFTIGKYLLSIYFAHSTAASVFGAAGSLAALLIWVYYSAQILFFGAEFTQVYAKARGRVIPPGRDAEAMTSEKREQLGLTPAKTSGSPVKAGPAPSVPLVVIAHHAHSSYWVAVGGMVVGLAMGAGGLWMGKRYKRDGVARLKVNQRLEAVEKRVRETARRGAMWLRAERQSKPAMAPHAAADALRG